MHCQALSLTSGAARRIADRLVTGDQLDRATTALAALYMNTLAATLERVELERAGQLTFLETAFQAELFGSQPSVARAATSNAALVAVDPQGQ